MWLLASCALTSELSTDLPPAVVILPVPPAADALGTVGNDVDGDGLDADEEALLDTDPNDADTDDDRLEDGDEQPLGCNPRVADTDGDSYLDGDEVATGHDAADASDLIYTLGWPYNPFKDEIADPGPGSVVGVGEVMPAFLGIDRAAEAVHLYDFAGQGLVFVTFSVGNCVPCDDVAGWPSGSGAYAGLWPDAAAALTSGDVAWVDVLVLGADLLAAGATDAAAWDARWPRPGVAVLADPSNLAGPSVGVNGIYPAAMLLDANMTVIALNPLDWTVAAAALQATFP